MNKIYKTEIIRSHSLIFDEAIIGCEDVKFNVDYLSFCSGVLFVESPLYIYLVRQGSVIHSYHADALWHSLIAFYWRVPIIPAENIGEYCDGWLYSFLQNFHVTLDPRNEQSFFTKMRYNQKMMRSEPFTYCVTHATGKKESPLVMKLLRTQNYYLWWAFEKVGSLKTKLDARCEKKKEVP